jgi:ectoine hydroxylase-related dioxygenase (phytanoyl-CoA dioxygenase family)
MERVDQMLKEMDLVYAEMAPGDGLFFHSNVMHRSDQNRSPNRRWTVLFCYNAAHNTPYKAQAHASYNKLNKVPDHAVKAAGIRLSDPSQSQFQTKKDHVAPVKL